MQQPSHNLDVAAGCFLSTPHELPPSGPVARLRNYAPPAPSTVMTLISNEQI
jgi:hypothetical protein